MKILKNNLTEPIKCTCSDCGSIFEFDYKDIHRREVTSFALLGDVISKRFVVCPICAYENEYSNNRITKEKLNKALNAFDKYSSEKKEENKNTENKDVKPVDNKETIEALDAFSRFCTKEFKDEQ